MGGIFPNTKEESVSLYENITFTTSFHGTIILDQEKKTNEQHILFVHNIASIAGFVEE